ncbi:substrate-binding domain-containing protein [Aquabacter sp. L1I39]|uniref:molybdate ABC transporter substrate-binding protein n=1 Tax=Aquabacter sp. L1I39 TaxID=2820278 RepID=UPI001ADA1816|nr:substrate-binding domain-containing protein [Aquabacter sp. L1I39]QTL02541.1 substrate-binding domain-containing protein [Aquabacter sp. L1I39]
MTSLRVLSGGAAHGLVRRLAPAFKEKTGLSVDGEFGAVGGMATRFREGDPADFLILTRALIETIDAEGRLVPGSITDVGRVATCVAVPAGHAHPDVHTPEALKGAWQRAESLFVPDMTKSTAGQHVAKVLAMLGLAEEMAPRIREFPNGATAMAALAAAGTPGAFGCTQATEILATDGLDVIGELPGPLALTSMYTAAVALSSPRGAEAAQFIAALASASIREDLGFSV